LGSPVSVGDVGSSDCGASLVIRSTAKPRLQMLDHDIESAVPRHPVLELDPMRGYARLRRMADLRAACARRWIVP